MEPPPGFSFLKALILEEEYGLHPPMHGTSQPDCFFNGYSMTRAGADGSFQQGPRHHGYGDTQPSHSQHPSGYSPYYGGDPALSYGEAGRVNGAKFGGQMNQHQLYVGGFSGPSQPGPVHSGSFAHDSQYPMQNDWNNQQLHVLNAKLCNQQYIDINNHRQQPSLVQNVSDSSKENMAGVYLNNQQKYNMQNDMYNYQNSLNAAYNAPQNADGQNSLDFQQNSEAFPVTSSDPGETLMPATKNPSDQKQRDSNQSELSVKAPKLTRTDFSDFQLQSLVAIFSDEKNPSVERRDQIAESLGMKPEQVKIWFKNRRARCKNTSEGEKARKRTRTKYTDAQQEILLNIFKDYPNPKDAHLEEISKDVDIKVEALKNWFKNRRADVKKQGQGIKCSKMAQQR